MILKPNNNFRIPCPGNLLMVLTSPCRKISIKKDLFNLSLVFILIEKKD